MGNSNTITVQLSVKDDGTVTIQKFGKTGEESLNKVSSAAKNTTPALNAIKDSYLELTAKAATAYMAVQKAMEYMEKGAKAQQAEDSFRSLSAASGESADKIINNMKRATNGTIDDSLLMQKAVKASLLDLTTEQTTQIAEMARLAARTTGEDVSTAFDNIVNAISTKMPRALKQYGLITKEQQSIVSQAMSEGVDDVDMFSIAWENYNKQLMKSGDLYENDAERLQQYKAQIGETQETFGKYLTIVEGWSLNATKLDVTGPLMATLAAISTMSTAPFQGWEEDSLGIKEAEEQLVRYQQRLKSVQDASKNGGNTLAGLQEIAQRKANLETMKALDKTYFADRESLIKNNLEILKAAGADEYQIVRDSINKRIELLTEYSNRVEQEIQAEAETRSKADREKLADMQYVAEKMKALDADVAAKNRQMQHEKVALAIQTAQEDLKNLTSRLSDYQSYYDKLKALMDKNTEDEKKHLDELKAIQQQNVDLDNSTDALIAGMKGTDASQTKQQQYESARSALTSQYANALNLSGQEEIDALEKYKQAVASLQAQFAQGIKGETNIFGNTDDIISAKKITEDAISDIERAYQSQKNALAELTAQKEAQNEADEQWGQVLQEEAVNAQTAMQNLQNTIMDLSVQIMNMQTTITLTGEDRVSSVVDNIISRLEYMHDLASQSVKIGGGRGIGYSDLYNSWGSLSPNTNPYLDLNAELNLSAHGNVFSDGQIIPYSKGGIVESTVVFPMAYGEIGMMGENGAEAVMPLTRNSRGDLAVHAVDNNSSKGGIVINGGINLQIPAAAAPQRPEDWRMITRNYIVPELKKLSN